jgi:hypothetical protein
MFFPQKNIPDDLLLHMHAYIMQSPLSGCIEMVSGSTRGGPKGDPGPVDVVFPAMVLSA